MSICTIIFVEILRQCAHFPALRARNDKDTRAQRRRGWKDPPVCVHAGLPPLPDDVRCFGHTVGMVCLTLSGPCGYCGGSMGRAGVSWLVLKESAGPRASSWWETRGNNRHQNTRRWICDSSVSFSDIRRSHRRTSVDCEAEAHRT